MAQPAIVLKPIPAPHLDIDAIRLEMLNALRKEGKEDRKALDKTTATWSGAKPTFKTESISLAGGDASVTTVPKGDERGVQKWVWLNEGTEAHMVPKSGTATMAFHPRYSAKTRPGRLSSRRGGPMGGRIVRRGQWMVSGIEAREWDKALAKQRKRPFGKAMAKAIKRGSEKAGLR